MALMIFLLCTVTVVVKASHKSSPAGYHPGVHLATPPRAITDLDDDDAVVAVPTGADGAAFVDTLPESYDSPQYSYSYGLRKTVNGATKSHHEARNGELVEGNYKTLDPDGLVRTVNYAMDSSNGYKAVMHKKSPMMMVMAPDMIEHISIPWTVFEYTFPTHSSLPKIRDQLPSLPLGLRPSR